VIITYWKGVFVADSLDERVILKKAGFELHEPTICNLRREECKACKARIGRRWWTNRIESATRLRAYCNDRALRVMKSHLEMLAKSRAVDAKISVPAPDGLEYYPYQKAGIAYAIQRKDTLIADDMGLGKSIEAIGFLNYIKPKNTIIVCPATLIFNWRNEAEAWLTGFDSQIVEVQSREDRVPEGDGFIVIVNYEKLVNDSPFLGSIAARTWDVAIFDEAHYLKNPESKRSQACIGQEGIMRRSHRCLFLTGTPIENYPKEIWPIISAISPAKFGDWWAFAKRYCGAHEEERNGKKVWVTEGATHLAELQQRLRATCMVRRKKEDVLPELPPKIRQLVVLRDDKVDWSGDPRFRKWQQGFDREYDEKLARLEAARTEAEFIEAASALDKVTGIPFEEISELRHELGKAKVPACLKFIDEVRKSTDDSLVLFAYHRDVVDALAKHVGDDAVVVHGGTPQRGPRSREVAVKLFQEKKKKIFIGQMRAAGVGLTLTAASTAIFVEEDWVPGAVTQCEDRLCRIGQKKMVHVIHAVLQNTIEVNMVQKVLAKMKVIDAALDKFPGLKKKHEAARTQIQSNLPLQVTSRTLAR
jgi:SWI/SNF-related matrix-associated actin-dependent regulator 1 of chromatin subfamily A